MESGGFRGKGRGRGRDGGGGGRGRGRGRDAWHHQQEQQGRGSNQGWSRRQVVPNPSVVQQGHAPMVSGRGAGAGPSFARVLSTQSHESSTSSPAGHVPGAVVPAMESLAISKPALPSSSSSAEILLPMKRPDNGGTNAIKKLSLLVNHFVVKFDPEKIIWHYDVDVKPMVTSSDRHPGKISKSNLYLIRKQMSTVDPEQFPFYMTVYDGEKSIFSVAELPTGEFRVQLFESSYLVTLKLVNELRLSQLNDYIGGRVLSVPRDILQAMDLALKENPKRRMFSPTRSSRHQADDLGGGIIASRESKYSLKQTSQGLALCLDYSVMPFCKPLPVIEYLEKQIYGFDVNKFGNFKEKVEYALKGLEVYKAHLNTNRRHKIAGLTSNGARDISFSIEDRQTSLVDYFKGKYGKDIKYQGIPCLELGKKNGTHVVPIEFCVVAEGQRYPKELLDRDATKKLKDLSLPSPIVRQNIICDMVKDADGPCGGQVVQNFGMEASTDMTRVEGRVLISPQLFAGAPRGKKMKINVNEKCHWNLVGDRCLVEGIQIDRWAILDFTSNGPYKQRLRPELFVPGLIARCNKLGIDMGEPLHYQNARMNDLYSEDVLGKMLEYIQRQSYEKGKGRLQLLLCVMAEQHPGYGCLKFVSETKVGIMTQCCLSFGANQAKDQYLANLALKINSKLGGHNVEIYEPLLRFKGEGDVMFIGADVNHPGKNSTSPSIAAVVASMSWPAPNRYAARICPQDPGSEKIQDFSKMCLELVESYYKLNNLMPKKIVIFRDGVSESQFDMVLNKELADVKTAFQAMNYFPTITLIVAQKRHHTRFFPMYKQDGGSSGNVPPGTVIDSTVVDPSGFHFHLFSQYGMIGTSKSTQYHVLWDEHGFTSDHIQQLLHSMCFTSARCTKSVSLIPPVKYADLTAYRGRLYQQVLDRQSQASSRSSSSSAPPSQPSAAAFDKSSYRVHPDLLHSMFFI
ncbi:argonaute 2 [Hibiscus trionum]|uniref:Argonaute 2 n=1 Tax=Hibiscus trionum TaxID=183268 RepID=A0A9W7M9V2_HIBTR|nr:argonaute 2 [Hibiscus trionum]